MKLKQKNKKSKLTILWIVLAVLVVAILAFVIVNAIIQDQNGKEIVNISIDIPPRLTYNVGEDFDPTGARLQVVTRDPKNTQFVYLPNKDVEFSGFDSSKAVDSQVVTVKYQGFTTTIYVKIVDPQIIVKPTVVSIEVCDLIDEYTVEKWNTNGANLYGAYLKLTYSDGSTKGSYEETPLLWDYIEPLQKVDAPGTTYMTIVYTDIAPAMTITVPITIN